jgi:hypothetical protein
MGTKRQKIQMELAFMTEGRGEAPRAANKGTEVSMAALVKHGWDHRDIVFILLN